ncbi:MAG: ribose-5-phosphate isomerase [Candidatus Nitrosocaldaceae archaeon]|nr:MAG: ribose-5-phosphate isomerase [Candidatus Nitrosocaldaceae archaeon]GIU72724.1 MAG: ribose-5-phosphate isomerase [Candidatus Nitrosocaldaceae archaeon]
MKAFVDAGKYVRDGMIIGLGSGSTIAKLLDLLNQRIKDENLKIKVIPTSLQIKLKAEELGLEIADDTLIPKIDLVYDGADQIDDNLNMIKGGGGALLREKIVMYASKKSIILADDKKYVRKLDWKVPIEVLPYARSYVIKRLESMNGKPIIRMLNKGYPFITENGNIILDTDFGVIEEPEELEQKVRSIPGVIEIGIFVRSANIYYRLIDDERFEIREQ